MNIFFLHLNPKKSAFFYCDQHMKILLEIVQMLFTAMHCCEEDGMWKNNLLKRVKKVATLYGREKEIKIYKPCFINHPMSIWIRTSIYNWNYATQLGCQLAREFAKRYKKIHICSFYIGYFASHPPKKWNPSWYRKETILAQSSIPPLCTPPPLCMPKQYIHYNGDLIKSYRAYYVKEKLKFATWTR